MCSGIRIICISGFHTHSPLHIDISYYLHLLCFSFILHSESKSQAFVSNSRRFTFLSISFYFFSASSVNLGSTICSLLNIIYFLFSFTLLIIYPHGFQFKLLSWVWVLLLLLKRVVFFFIKNPYVIFSKFLLIVQ